MVAVFHCAIFLNLVFYHCTLSFPETASCLKGIQRTLLNIFICQRLAEVETHSCKNNEEKKLRAVIQYQTSLSSSGKDTPGDTTPYDQIIIMILLGLFCYGLIKCHRVTEISKARSFFERSF